MSNPRLTIDDLAPWSLKMGRCSETSVSCGDSGQPEILAAHAPGIRFSARAGKFSDLHQRFELRPRSETEFVTFSTILELIQY